MASQSRHDLKTWMLKMIAAGFAALPLLLLVTAALCVLTGTARADIFVSRLDGNVLQKFKDDGSTTNFTLTGGDGAGEGVMCVNKAANKIFVASNSTYVDVYDLDTGNFDSHFQVSTTSSLTALSATADGTRLYVADNARNKIWELAVSSSGTITGVVAQTAAITSGVHDVVVGPDGNIYATNFPSVTTGVFSFNSSLSVGPTTFISNGAGNGPGLSHAGGMVFDGAGNLWVSNTQNAGPNDGIFEFTGPQNSQPGQPLNFTPDPNSFTIGLDVSPINPPGPPTDPCKGCILFTELTGRNGNHVGSLSQIDPTTCTGTIAHPGTCTLPTSPYITLTSGAEPKYVRFTENCCDTGYVEICKLTCVYNQVTGYFNFTASNSGVTVGPLSIPVNACSPPIQIPNGTINIKETQRLGVVLNNVIAYDYDYFGNQLNALLSENLPFTNANVNVVSGDISTETVVGFTNCASGPGELKICKVAGSNDLVGDTFTFTAKGFGAPIRYMVQAGPPPGGYCVVAGSYQAGTPVLVTEPAGQNNSMVSNIAVAPPDRQGAKTGNSVIAVIDSGTTEVTFTDVDMPRGCSGPNLLINGSFETGDFTGWTSGGNFTDSQVVSGPFYPFSGAENGLYYAVLGPAGSDGTLSQTLTTTQGQSYHVCFWLWAVGDMPSDFAGLWNGNQFISLSNPNTGNMWKQYVEGAFTGTGNDTLTFSFRDDSGYIALDNVMVTSP